MRTAGTFDLEPGDVEHESAEGRNYMEVLAGAGAWLAAPTDLVTILNSLDASTPGDQGARARHARDDGNDHRDTTIGRRR